MLLQRIYSDFGKSELALQSYRATYNVTSEINNKFHYMYVVVVVVVVAHAK